jgi:ubiquinone/menaquinone biosynthesis C-methylase UbiE
MDPSLPLIDIGCGNGRQTRFLAQHFRRVIGVDVSPAAIELACRECTAQANAEFRVFNATHVEEARALHDELGDVNIYMRGVLHAIQPADRPKVVASLAILLGARGTLYQIELSTAALTYFRQLPGDSPSGLPRLLHSVVRYGIQPVGFNLKDRRVCYPDADWSVLASGENVTINTVRLSHGAEGHVPANYLLLRQR